MSPTLFSIATLFAFTLSPAEDARLLQGEWRCTSMNIEGEQVKLSVASKMRLTVDDKHLLQEAAGNELQKLSYKVLPDGVIRFDVGETWFLGRYELRGRELRLCYPGPISNEGRPLPPARFEARKGVNLSTWQRD